MPKVRKKRIQGKGKRYKKNKGYNLEHYGELTLLFNGYHASKKPMSQGVEDIVAMKKEHKSLYVQAKNHAYERIIKGKLVKIDPTKALSDMGKEILKFHAEEFDAIPVFLYKESRGKNVWLNLSTNKPIDWLKPYTKEWVEERSRLKKKLSALKDPKKGGSIEKWELYVLEHKDEVSKFIC